MDRIKSPERAKLYSVAREDYVARKDHVGYGTTIMKGQKNVNIIKPAQP